MKTILCPINTTPRSDRLLKYVGSLAKDRNCKIYVVSSQPGQKKELALMGARGISSRLDEVYEYLSGIMGVPCGIIEESVSGNLYKKLGALSDHYDIMAIMVITSGEENAKDLDLARVIQDTLAPILVIPDRFPYRKINRLLYAYDYKHEPEPPVMQLNWLADWFDCEIVFITLLPGDVSIKEESTLTSFQSTLKQSWQGHNIITFETIVYPNLPKGLEHYLGLSNANDLLVISINQQNVLERMWHKRFVNGSPQYSKHPYLIIHN